VLYSPSYRCRYGDFTRRNYPRVLLTSDRKLFEKLVGFGSDLIQLHLFRTAPPVTSTYPVAGSNVVSAAKFELASAPGIGRIRINKTQFIDGVATTVWDFTIGGYQVAQPQRWLNYRKGRTLSFDDVSYYQRMLGALAETIRIQAEIDAVVPGWPLA
jgi:hypothetical protein